DNLIYMMHRKSKKDLIASQCSSSSLSNHICLSLIVVVYLFDTKKITDQHSWVQYFRFSKRVMPHAIYTPWQHLGQLTHILRITSLMEIGIGLGLAWANKRNKIWAWATDSLDMFHMAPDTIPNRKLKELVNLHGWLLVCCVVFMHLVELVDYAVRKNLVLPKILGLVPKNYEPQWLVQERDIYTSKSPPL
ncbi:hypothetical protein ACJX0J_013149, partial [Zea mays]